MTKKIAGILPALMTPMFDDGKIDFEGVKKLATSLFDQGVHGLYVGGSTGEGILLSIPERQAVLESAIETARGRGTVMVHIGAVATGDAIELARHAKEVGADAVSSVPPFAFGKNRDGLLAHYRAICGAVDIPMYLYNIPSLTSVHVTQDIIEELNQLPNVVGMKFSSYDLFAEYRIIANVRDFDVFHGSDETLLYGLMVGAVGGIGLSYNFLPALYVRIYDEHKRGNFALANMLQKKASQLIDIFLKFSRGNEIGLGKALLSSYQPVVGGPARLPNLPVDDSLLAELKEELDQFGLLADSIQTFLEEAT